MSIYKLLDIMLTLVETAPSVPFTDFKMLKSKDMQDLIEQAVSEVPSEIASSRKIMGEQERLLQETRQQAENMLNQAHREAESVIMTAQQEAAHILSQSEIIKAVNAEAEKIRQRVHEETKRIYELTEREIAEAEEQAQYKIQGQLEEAVGEAENIKQNAYSYANYILEQMERLTGGALEIIHTGQKQIENFARSNQQDSQQRFKAALDGGEYSKAPSPPESE